MNLSRERLVAEAEATGFTTGPLEKVAYLLALLEGFNRHPLLRGKLALKGGTALNMFLFDVPRLSVDIDLNYIGATDRETMMAERPVVETAIMEICRRERLSCEDFLPEPLEATRWAHDLLTECAAALEIVLPLEQHELDFLEDLLEQGDIRPELLTSDEVMQERIRSHPALAWKAQNVKSYRSRP